MVEKIGTKPDGDHPIITVTGEEEIVIWDLVADLDDVKEPTGDLCLEFIPILRKDESSLSVWRMKERAIEEEANLGLRHCKAFLERYQNEGFGLPEGTGVPFFGTVTTVPGGHKFPALIWNGSEWELAWFRIETFDPVTSGYFLRPACSN